MTLQITLHFQYLDACYTKQCSEATLLVKTIHLGDGVCKMLSNHAIWPFLWNGRKNLNLAMWTQGSSVTGVTLQLFIKSEMSQQFKKTGWKCFVYHRTRHHIHMAVNEMGSSATILLCKNWPSSVSSSGFVLVWTFVFRFHKSLFASIRQLNSKR